MKKLIAVMITSLLLGSNSWAGGTPDLVTLPDNYQTEFTLYDWRNRLGQPQVAKIYANRNLLNSVKATGTPGEGSKVVMEIYTPKMKTADQPETGADGHYVIDQLKSIAVMEKRDQWPVSLPASERSGNWAFALYSADGKPLANDQDCTGCHTQLIRIDYMFSLMQLRNHAGWSDNP